MPKNRNKKGGPRIVTSAAMLPMPPSAELIEEAQRPGVRKRNGLKKVELPAAVRALHELATPALREATIQAQEWLFARVAEVHQTHGAAGVGVCALLQQAAQSYAWSWYLDAKAREADGQGKGATCADYARSAAQHGQFARQHELAAYEIAYREGRAARDAASARAQGKSALLAAQDEG